MLTYLIRLLAKCFLGRSMAVKCTCGAIFTFEVPKTRELTRLIRCPSCGANLALWQLQETSMLQVISVGGLQKSGMAVIFRDRFGDGAKDG